MKNILFTLALGLFLSGAAFAQENNPEATSANTVQETKTVDAKKTDAVETLKAEAKETKAKSKSCCKKGHSKTMATASPKGDCGSSASTAKDGKKACCKKGSAKDGKGCHGSKAMAANESDDDDKSTQSEKEAEKQ